MQVLSWITTVLSSIINALFGGLSMISEAAHRLPGAPHVITMLAAVAIIGGVALGIRMLSSGAR